MKRRSSAFRRSLASAFGLMTAVPVPGLRRVELDERDVRNGTVWYPFVGLCIALPAAGAALVLENLGAGAELIAFAVLAVPLLLTKFFHFDGLCDVLDGFLAAKTPERTREIMKDSRVGAYALGGGALYLLARWVLLLEWARSGQSWGMLFICFACSRTMVVGVAACSTPVPGSTLGAGIIGKTPRWALFGALATLAAALGSTVALSGSTAPFNGLVPNRYFGGLPAAAYVSLVAILFLAAVFAGLLVAAILESWSRKKIQGLNGDVLGAVIELSELAFVAAILGGTSWLVRI